MEKSLKRSIHRLLARVPALYLAVLMIFRRGSPEKRMYIAIVRNRDVVLDVGANVGHFTQLFCDLVGSSGQVHAFEPVPSTFELLSGNLAPLSLKKNVFLNCVALGEQDQETVLFIPNEDHGQAALVRHRAGSWTSNQIREVKVQMIRLDRYAERIPRIDFIKCDAEGAELLVLRGGESTLRRCRPKIFLEVEEFWTRSFGWTPEEVVRFLRELGYQHFYRLGSQGLEPESDRFAGGGLLCTWEKMSGMA